MEGIHGAGHGKRYRTSEPSIPYVITEPEALLTLPFAFIWSLHFTNVID